MLGRGWVLAGRAVRDGARGGQGWTRRRALAAALVAGGAPAAAGLLAACGRLSARVAEGPTRAAAAPVVLSFLPPQAWPTAVGPALWDVLRAALQPFLSAHPGVDVRLFADQGYQGATEAAMLAGAGPDVLSDWVLRPFVEHGLLLDLAPFVQRDHLSLGIFPSGEMVLFREAGRWSPGRPAGLFAVPAYLHTQAYAVNLDLVAAAHRAPPEPDWTVGDWTRLWQAVTVPPGRGKPSRFGTDLDDQGYDYGANMITPYRLWGYGGEYVDPADPTRCDLTSPGSLACGRARYQLLWDGVAGFGDFLRGTVVSTHATGTFGAQVLEAQQWHGFRWDYFPDPVWPVRRSAYAATDFFGIWAGTRHPEAAWALLKWLAFGPDWQRIVMRTSLAGPNQPALWEEWKQVVGRFAPPLRAKNLDAFVVPVQRGEPYAGRSFRYASAGVKRIIARYASLLAAQSIGVDSAFREMAQQIDALQRSAADGATARAAARTSFPARVAAAQAAAAAGRPPTFPQPPAEGVGAPPVAAPALARANRAAARVTLIGEGAGVAGDADSMTLAAQAWVEARGRFVCRLASVAAHTGNRLSDGAKIGLMARGALSTMAAEIGVEVAVGRGVHMHVRPFAGTALGDYRPALNTQPAGLIGADVILRPAGQPAQNYLLRPVWLRLDFAADRWTAYTSLDGHTWTAVFGALGVGFLGCWVGVYATAHGGNDVVAAFDHLSGFFPDRFVTVGVTAPSAG